MSPRIRTPNILAIACAAVALLLGGCLTSSQRADPVETPPNTGAVGASPEVQRVLKLNQVFQDAVSGGVPALTARDCSRSDDDATSLCAFVQLMVRDASGAFDPARAKTVDDFIAGSLPDILDYQARMVKEPILTVAAYMQASNGAGVWTTQVGPTGSISVLASAIALDVSALHVAAGYFHELFHKARRSRASGVYTSDDAMIGGFVGQILIDTAVSYLLTLALQKNSFRFLTAQEQGIAAILTDPDSQWIGRLYKDASITLVNPSELQGWKQMTGAHGREAVVSRFLRTTPARMRVIREWYETYLGRTASGREQNFWIEGIFLKGTSADDAFASLIGSEEFYRRNTTAPTADATTNLIVAYYRDLLLFPNVLSVSPEAVAQWAAGWNALFAQSLAQTGLVDHSHVVASRQTLWPDGTRATFFLTCHYQWATAHRASRRYLGRDATEAEQRRWCPDNSITPQEIHGIDDFAVLYLTSQEYYAKAQRP